MKIIIPLLAMSTILLLSCQLKQDFTVDVTIHNESKIVYDSIRIHIYPDRDTMLYNVKPSDKIAITFQYKNFEYSRKEALAALLIAFEGEYYYRSEDGIIDIPYAYLKDRYDFYLYDGYTTIKKGYVSKYKLRYKISEMPK